MNKYKMPNANFTLNIKSKKQNIIYGLKEGLVWEC